MTQKIEIVGDTLRGPWTIKIGDAIIEYVENYELWVDENFVHHCSFTLLTDSFQVKRAERREEVNSPEPNQTQEYEA